ncbi:phenylalanine--tRNA ligase subunit alpha [Candidatus Woesearchaeota archaeon]|nr:MAG: phenylalanine--tRNA ligase subunit alpha [Candidatus Woesearchaeota archaeon]
MDLKKLARSLHKYERRVLPELEHSKYVEEIARATGLKDVEVVRALQWLENKGAIVVHTEQREIVHLDSNGEKYAKGELPERIFLRTLKDGPIPVKKLAQKTGLDRDEVNVCIGLLREKGAILLLKEKELAVKITDKGKRLLESELPEEQFLKKAFPVDVRALSPKEKEVLKKLRKRKGFVRIEVLSVKRAELTDVGKELLKLGVRDEDLVDRITPQVLASGSWKGKEFRRYDVTSKVPEINGGKLQPYRAFLDRVRQKFLSLGFEEMTGPIVETDFWDMDALFMPQFHSARDIHDAYYVKEPKEGKVDQNFLKKVRAVHENGGSTKSKGWGYSFDVKRTRRLLLRTQGTACSARKLASPDLKVPGKYFGITRNFRHDVIDATHLPDFNQTEGIVVGEDLNFRHLIGLLRIFAKEFANTESIRLVPGYFPYTEPSVELYAKHPDLGWIELGGAGMFRPEVVEPLVGRHLSVCAWGLGIDRLAMFNLGFKDIRDLFSADLAFLRKSPVM